MLVDTIRHCRIIRSWSPLSNRHFFSKLVHDYLTDDELRGFQSFLAINPDVGDVVRGSGRCSQVRWARRGTGKSSGVRVLYFARTQAGEIF